MRATLLLTLLMVFHFSYGQRTDEDRRKALQEITKQAAKDNEARIQRVEAYLSEKGAREIEETEEGKERLLYDISPSGKPIYLITDNDAAATTTGADVLTGFGSSDLGFSLGGEGVKIAVWDGGLVRSTHVELEGKVIQKDGSSSLSNHANHVTGTILARGVNTSARGMAPEAQAEHYDFN
ncbi:MAG: hypothetical protein WBA74_01645, partial [Cyclobacteriaceae bacterium]